MPCRDAEAVRASLDAWAASYRQRLLDPVRVHTAGTPLGIPVNGAAGETVHWRLATEDATAHEGTVAVKSLPAMDPEGEGHRAGWRWLNLDLELPAGYHTLHVTLGARRAAMPLVVTPGCCYLPAALEADARWWGLGVQLYGVRRARDFGLGDYSALGPLLRLCARQGGAFVGVSPLHAMFPEHPEHASPYSPSSRLFLNVLFIDVERVPEVADSPVVRARLGSAEIRDRLTAVRREELVNYAAAAELKLSLLREAFAESRARGGDERQRAFRQFCEARGDPLLRHALFEALQGYFHEQDPTVRGWEDWPRVYQDPASAAVARFAEDEAERVDFHRWLQWLADEQLAAATADAAAEETEVGLYLDVAVSVDPNGAEAWANQHLYALDASVGAPGDVHNPMGQDWGLPPMNPRALEDSGYALFIDTLRRNMAHAGAIRIDHVMALMRLFWIPRGATPDAGAYVHYPLRDLLGIVALESQRNRCIVVGEDLGTVPEALADVLPELRILSYRLLYFEQRGDRRFAAPGAYPRRALVSVSTHDLPTLSGWWGHRDLEWREALDLFPDQESLRRARADRDQDRDGLLAALADADLEVPAAPSATALGVAVHRYLARTPAMLQLVQLEDALALEEQANLPGVVEGHPNWRRRMPVTVEELPATERFTRILRAVADERQAAPGGAAPRPRATYRLQLNRDFTFADARALVDYLHGLGISHVYASPYLASRSGSPHGYDVVDHGAIDPEIGTPEELATWARALGERGMSQVLDIVPNHMGVMGDDNAWWLDVLEHGQAAVHGDYFDIDWEPPDPGLAGRILVPVLGDFYGQVLGRGELALVFDPDSGSLGVRYHEHLFPIDPARYPRVLDAARRREGGVCNWSERSRMQLASVSAAFAKLPGRGERDPAAVAERYRDSAVLRGNLRELYHDDAAVAECLDASVAAFNDDRGALHALMEEQAWRLAHWRTASDEINYRRFFDINNLAGLRVERDEVFEAVHRRILALVADGTVTGLRVDHPDGLYDPAGYFRRLASRCAEVRPAAAPVTYLLAEKILAVDEALPEDWSLSGTTGYEFASLVNGVFVDPHGRDGLDRAYTRFVGETVPFGELAYRCKRLVTQRLLAAELRVLGNRLHRLAQADIHTRDYTLNHLSEALREVVACFPVYRTYIRTTPVSEPDREHVERAVRRARGRSDAVDVTVFDFIRDVLLQRRPGGPEYRRAMLAFTMKFQQYTAPVTAKGIEDTALYRDARLLSLNDVGDDPGRFGVPVSEFHRGNAERLASWPRSMLATSSHDSKRGEDVRARLDVLSELPREWRERVERWRRSNLHLVRDLEGGPAPGPNDEYFLYQTLLGAWPLEALDDAGRAAFGERIEQYMTKAVREARRRSSWHAPDDAYEAAVTAFVAGVTDPRRSPEFLADFLDFKNRLAPIGLLNALSRTLLKLASPGVPDIYRGSELWNFDLVDPDNRRPVDYRLRRRLLDRLGPPGSTVPPEELLDELASGLPKLYLIRQLLDLRGRYPTLFERGGYLPVRARGRHGGRLCSFVRHDRRAVLLVVAPRLVAPLCGEAGAPPLGARWQDTALELPEPVLRAARGFRDVLTGETHHLDEPMPLRTLLGRFPLAALLAEPGGEA
ncbi:MAG: malto-oligosyltrehalose synthase [Pseudomonadota bacterium]